MGKEPKTFNQEYRDNLATKLREKRSETDSGQEDAQKILEHEKKGVFYNDAEQEHTEGDQFETRRESFNKRMEDLKKEAEKFGYTLNIEDFDSEKEMFLERVKAEVTIGEKIGKKLTLVENRIKETKSEEEKIDLENSEEAFSYIQDSSLSNAEITYDFVENDLEKEETINEISNEEIETDTLEDDTKEEQNEKQKEEQKPELSGNKVAEVLRKANETKKERETKEVLPTREQELNKIKDSAEKSLKWMKGKNDAWSTNSMISREERKLKDAKSELGKLETEAKKGDSSKQEDKKAAEKYQEPIEEKDLNIFPEEEKDAINLDDAGEDFYETESVETKTRKDTDPYSGWDNETLINTYKENLKLIDGFGENAAESLKTQVASIKKALEKRGLLKKQKTEKAKLSKKEVDSLLEKANEPEKENSFKQDGNVVYFDGSTEEDFKNIEKGKIQKK